MSFFRWSISITSCGGRRPTPTSSSSPKLAHRHKLELFVDTGDVAAHARSHHLSTEAAARQLRYQYFRQLFEEKKLNRIATGHTLDDQAETVLLRVVRGAGTRGLAGIYPQLSFELLIFRSSARC